MLPSNDDVMSSTADAPAYSRSDHAGAGRSGLPGATQHCRPAERHDGGSDDSTAGRPRGVHATSCQLGTRDGARER